jgi:phosphotransferase family enzyme
MTDLAPSVLNYIDVDNVIDYLLDKKLIDTKAIVDGGLTIVDVSRRNRNIKVFDGEGNIGYFLKQPNLNEPHYVMTIQKEACVYDLIQRGPVFAALRSIIPSVIGYDQVRNILNTRLIQNGVPVGQYIRQTSNSSLLRGISSSLGKTMAEYHTKLAAALGMRKASFFPKAIPSTFFASRPGPDIFSHISGANLELIKVIQNYPELYEPLEKLHSEWQVQTLIHGDFRWDNLLVIEKDHDDSDGKNINSSFQLKLVDWEFSDLGDPAWDIGCALHEYLTFWLFSLSITGNQSSEQLISSNNHVLRNMQSSIREFWHAYIKVSNIDGHTSEKLLQRSTKFSSVRLVQTVYESMLSSTELTNTAMYFLQIAANILNHNEDAILYIFGVPFQEPLNRDD